MILPALAALCLELAAALDLVAVELEKRSPAAAFALRQHAEEIRSRK